jgi:MoaA/NifB/PqqE/SkfB family radical SAM enzyme
MYLYSGGEPLVRKKDIIRLCEKHSDCMFAAFTNGTLIDEAFADEMLRVKNFIPAISVEGFEDETDNRRGKGTYQKVLQAMEILKERRLPFGASCCYTSQNTNVIGSEEYIDSLIDKGCKFAWFFTYMPVGAGAPTELIATAEQREYMYKQIRTFRETKQLFTMDFWNDGEYVEGCAAGGRYYLHINANGDYEPCAFIHYSDSNIREKTVLEALKSPLFMEYKKNQPFNKNHLRPCPLLDNNGKLAEMVHSSGAHSTDLCSPENVDDLCAKCAKTSENWAITADRLWNEKERKSV